MWLDCRAAARETLSGTEVCCNLGRQLFVVVLVLVVGVVVVVVQNST